MERRAPVSNEPPAFPGIKDTGPVREGGTEMSKETAKGQYIHYLSNRSGALRITCVDRPPTPEDQTTDVMDLTTCGACILRLIHEAANLVTT